uniref:Calmodulin-binding domain-containing protein n=1 Tax=Trichobilharzia regenti TaxID=157069 RepID=A0AA85J5M7_TRIRE|nr:unnamed protein product [Trichobilharzia regenti]
MEDIKPTVNILPPDKLDVVDQSKMITRTTHPLSTGITTLSLTNETIHQELSPPILMVTSPTENKTYTMDLPCPPLTYNPQNNNNCSNLRASCSGVGKMNQLTVNTVDSRGLTSLSNKLRRYSDQGGSRPLTKNDPDYSTQYKRQSLFNINSESNVHDYYNKSSLYPPTRTKNTSSSNVDLLAEAILQMSSTLKNPNNDYPSKSKNDCRRSTLGCAATGCFPLKLHSSQKPWSAVSEHKESYIPKCSSKEHSNSANTMNSALLSTAPTNSRRNSEFNHSNQQKTSFNQTSEESFNKSPCKQHLCSHHNPDEQKLKHSDVWTNQNKEVDLFKCHPINLDSNNANNSRNSYGQNHLMSPVAHKPPSDSTNVISLYVPNLPLTNKSLSTDAELTQRIRRVSMMLQSRRNSTTQAISQRNDPVNHDFTNLARSGCPSLLSKEGIKDEHRMKLRSTSVETDSYSGSPVKKTRISDQIHHHTSSVDETTDLNKEKLKTYENRNNFNDKSIVFTNKYKRERRLTERLSKGIGYHLGRRRRLLESRRRMADFALAFSIFGILAAFLDIEFISRSLYNKNSIYSMVMRTLISLSTVILLLLIMFYHTYDIMVFLCEEYTKDWRICVTKYRVIQIITELFICSIHPFPGIDLFFDRPFPVTNYINYKRSHPLHHLDDHFSPYLLLILPMLCRLYLALRALLLHSRMFNDAGSRSIGAMNKVSFDLQFVLKTLMTLCPAKALLIFITTIWVIFSWTLRACELEQGENHLSLLNSAWLISVTFLSIGYGDIVPHTSCGRLIAVATGLMGSACTALLVAVFSRKLEMTKAEKHVLHFMESNKLTKKVKHCAANVLRETWLLYKNAKLMPTFNPRRVRAHQRKFLQAIYRLRTMKVRQRELQDKSNSLVDLAKLQTNVYERVADISLRQEDFQNQLTNIEEMLQNIQKTLMQRRQSGTVALDKK